VSLRARLAGSALLVAAVPASAGTSVTPAGTRAGTLAGVSSARTGADAAVVADIRQLADEMRRTHPNLFHTVPRDEFDAAVERLVARVPELDGDALLVELMRLTALPGPRDGHTGLFPLASDHQRPFHLLPIRLWAFPEGLVVVAAPSNPDLLGARLVAIEGTPVEQLSDRVRPLVSRDNESGLLLRLPEYLITTEVLHGLGVTADSTGASLTLESTDGERLDVRLAALPGPRYVDAIGDIWAPPPPPSGPTPLWLRNRSRTQWLATLDRGRAVYAVYSMTTQSTVGFAERLLRRARQPKVRRVIVDVRLNGGGNNTTYGSLLRALRSRVVNRPGRLVLLTGRITYSAAGNFVAEVDARTRARIVGEAAGGSPHNYGDAVHVDLPAIGRTVYLATSFQQVLGRRDDRVAVVPDVPVAVTAADHFAGRDPVLARAVSLR
jgi:hypothetical protein